MDRLGRYGPDMNNRKYSKKPIYILLLLALLAVVAQYVFVAFSGSDGIFVYACLQYLAPMLLGTLFLLSALVVAIHHRIRKNSVRKAVTWLLAFVLMILAVVGGSTMYAMHIMEHPIAYYTSPGGTNRIVIMNGLSERMDTPSRYNAYPMKDRYFYRPTFMEAVDAPRGIESVVWESEELARVSLTDINNVPRVITLDFTREYLPPEDSPAPEVSVAPTASPVAP